MRASGKVALQQSDHKVANLLFSLAIRPMCIVADTVPPAIPPLH